MKIRLLLLITVSCLLINNAIHGQTGESKFKMVIINPNEKKVTALYPSFIINGLVFDDSNHDTKLEGSEEGFISFYLRNTGTVVLKQLNIDLSTPDTTKSISYTKHQNTGQIALGDSLLVKIPLSADETLKDGMASFKIMIKDANSDSSKNALLTFPTIELLEPPEFTWISPDTEYNTANFPVIEIIGLLKTKTNITGLKVFVNGVVPDDQTTFELLPTENMDGYRIKRKLTLNEGINEIKIEARNKKGTIVTEARLVSYSVAKIDNAYVEKRLALVIGNADYLDGITLQNPINDAKAIASALQEVGFTVMTYFNSDLKTMKKATDDFGEKLKDYTVGLFYYAGHGMQVKGNNYLIPVDASLKVEQDVDYDCLDAGRLLGKMEAAGTTTNIVILDACRDNPFARSWGTRSAGTGGTGLAFMNAPSGSIVAYATSPGKTASDGTGKNGLYTETLLQFIKVPNLSLLEFFQNVRAEVEKKSNKTQTPWEATSLKGNFYFKIQ